MWKRHVDATDLSFAKRKIMRCIINVEQKNASFYLNALIAQLNSVMLIVWRKLRQNILKYIIVQAI